MKNLQTEKKLKRNLLFLVEPNKIIKNVIAMVEVW